ncbi:MAG: ABC transporter ATP-binding protein [Spirochaetaceae bacterium]|jgi:peptide/nickel transport system ATP-binding protein/oligopeptide transport system ATP-binding protein|nr:ABC transporter ATP-binding protein [Spirochaetaceae bacterium]
MEVQNLTKTFKGPFDITRIGRPIINAVKNINLTVYSGEILGLVGESGCGKSTLGRIMLRLIDPSKGKVIFMGEDITSLSQHSMRSHRGSMQLVFQDPYSSLNPRMTVQELVQAPLDVFKAGTPESRQKRVLEMLDIVGLGGGALQKFPHEFSGGQRQRIGIARAMILSPRFIVCDEPVSALDLSVRAQILNMMKDIQKKFVLTYLFISHDLSVVEYMSDRVAVMYLGEIVELAENEELFHSPRHPYTQALTAAVPQPNRDKKYKLMELEGEIPSPFNPPPGCTFHPRCSFCMEVCKTKAPIFSDLGGGHWAACHKYTNNTVQRTAKE